ncbi:MAG TPA: hypothetical protein VF905_00160 [Nitrospirota bacterium]
MPSWPFEASLDDVFIGTLHHARTNRPTVALELRILHQRFPLEQVVQVLLDPFLLSEIPFETIS